MSAAYLNRENAKRSCPRNRKSTGCQSAIPRGPLRALEAAGKGQGRRQRGGRALQASTARVRLRCLFYYWAELCRADADQHNVDSELGKIGCSGMSLSSNEQKAL